ncbi:MAG: hypothetical protein C3F11_12055 [Methylocystaceae bacterium]|nr:MAG: hypothetical protein C3F11_12055 [Methylocystaceae bacterium]
MRAVGFQLDGNTQEQIDAARDAFVELARETHLFPEEQFPYLFEHRSGFYRIGEDADHRNALYVQVSTTHQANGPHQHPYWAIITGVRGNEINVLYERVDDGSSTTHGKLGNRREEHVTTGRSLFIPKKDFHTIQVSEDEVGVHLHFYGVGADTAAHRGVPRFSTPDSKDVIINSGTPEPGRIGVQRVSLSDVEEAQREGKPLGLLVVDFVGDALPAPFATAPRVELERIRVGADLPADVSTPVVVAGEGKAVRLAAEKLTRLGYFSTFWFDPYHA